MGPLQQGQGTENNSFWLGHKLAELVWRWTVASFPVRLQVVEEVTEFYKQTYNNYKDTKQEALKETLRLIHFGVSMRIRKPVFLTFYRLQAVSKKRNHSRSGRLVSVWWGEEPPRSTSNSSFRLIVPHSGLLPLPVSAVSWYWAADGAWPWCFQCGDHIAVHSSPILWSNLELRQPASFVFTSVCRWPEFCETWWAGKLII